MQVSNLPKPNTQALNWFFAENRNKSLVLNPKYQRNPIWSIGQNCFLIDSLISDCPIPQVFLNVITEGKGKSRKTFYEVVDGQQRLRAILDFMEDEYPLVKLKPQSYPVSQKYEPFIGKRYSELPDRIQEKLWNYPIAVQELRGWDKTQIRALFRRLNYVVEKLNKQEMRHSQYFGEFVTAVEGLATSEFWDTAKIFSRHDSQRMKDVEFISELFVTLIDGVQDQTKHLDKFYADYDVVFPGRSRFVKQFKWVLASLETIQDTLFATRFRKKADFYALFAATGKLVVGAKGHVDLSNCAKGLRKLDKEIDPKNKMNVRATGYYRTVIEGPNKLAKREERTSFLYELLLKSIGEG